MWISILSLLPFVLWLFRFPELPQQERWFLGAGSVAFFIFLMMGLKKMAVLPPKTKLAVGLLMGLATLALFAPLFSPHLPQKQFPLPACRYLPPLSQVGGNLFVLGTDGYGRCILSRMIFAARISLAIGLVATLLSLFLGTLYGMVAGWIGGVVSAFMMRLLDGFMAFPRLFILILIVASFSQASALWVVILLLGGMTWMDLARLIRAQVLSLREQPFLQAARMLQTPRWRIFLHHLLPFTLPILFVDGPLRIGAMILVESALSFLGVGVQPPTPSWGNMIADGKDVLLQAWWISLFPGLLLFITVFTFFLLGEGLKKKA